MSLVNSELKDKNCPLRDVTPLRDETPLRPQLKLAEYDMTILSSYVASPTNSSTDALHVSPYSLVYDSARTARMRAPNASLEVPRSKLNEGGGV